VCTPGVRRLEPTTTMFMPDRIAGLPAEHRGAPPAPKRDPRPPAPGRPPRRRVRSMARRTARSVRTRVLDGAEAVLDPVVRPVVQKIQDRRGGPTAEDLLQAYRRGRILEVGRFGRRSWSEPRRRAIIPLAQRRIPGGVAKLMRSGRFEVTFDTAFAEVVSRCATVDGRASAPRAWLTPAVQQAYLRLHELGHAHSVEVWREGDLVGGDLGVALGGYYSGDSSFRTERNAGKVALAHLNEHLGEQGFLLHDTQVVSPLSARYGAHYVPRARYREMLVQALAADVTF
jgi:leucyl/phenylalanyl-tRNA---protein transferase